jgi:hypothetical protein
MGVFLVVRKSGLMKNGDERCRDTVHFKCTLVFLITARISSEKLYSSFKNNCGVL